MFFRKTTVLMALAAAMCCTTRCHAQPPAPRLAGRLALSEGWRPTVYLVQPRNFAEIATSFGGAVVDSAAIGPDGRFAFAHAPRPDAPALFQICVQRTASRFPNQLLDDDPALANYFPVLLQKGATLEVAARADSLQATFSIQNPSPENRALLQLRDLRHRAFQAEKHLLNAADHADETALLEHEAALRRSQSPLMAFADSTAWLWPALVAARWVSPTGDYERVPEFLVNQCQHWRSKFPENQWVEQLCRAGNRDKLPVLVGDIIPDFPMPMAAGDTLPLHALLGPKLTVLDIWASWCAPCRRENRDVLAPLWAQHRTDGLQIIGYSIDSSPAAWRAAIAKDGAAWPHASHLTGDSTPFLDALRLTTIPANFIFDATGKVLAKNLHGEALRAFVAERLKRN